MQCFNRKAARVLALAALTAAFTSPAYSQVPPIDQLRRPSEVPLPAPEPDRPPPALRLPAGPLPATPSLAQGARFNVRGFRFTGNTVVPEKDLQQIAAPFVGREIGTLELDDLRVRVTRHYVDAGYINSGAVIPDQDVTEGIITVRIIEGRLSEIVLGGRNRYDPQVLRRRLESGAPAVLNVNQLQEHIQLLLQDPLIERINAELAPGVRPGEAVLRADVTSAPLFLGGITLSNERSPVVGADQIEGLLAVRNLLGAGETFSFRPAYTEGLRDYSIGLTLPVSARGTLLTVRAQRTYSDIVESPLDQLDIGAKSQSLEVGLAHPLIATPRRTLSASVSLAKRRSESFFLGQPSPFIPGSIDGRTTISVVRVGIDGVDRTPERVIAGRLQVSHGIDAFNSTISGPGIADSRFTALLGQVQWVQRVFGASNHFVFRAELQRANDALLGPEKYSIGGVESVRGYRKDLFVRDNGWLASLEYRHLLGNVTLPGTTAGPGVGALYAAVFADRGSAWDHDRATGVARISSVGPGLRWEPAQGLALQAYYGIALNNVATPTRTLQDRGVHLRASYTRAF